VLSAELERHLRAAAFAEDAEERIQHRGVVLWIQHWLSGSLMDRYAEEARQRFALGEDENPVNGSPWMQGDGGEP
jgi:hypothetical protein